MDKMSVDAFALLKEVLEKIKRASKKKETEEQKETEKNEREEL